MMLLKPAPRYERETYVKKDGVCVGVGFNVEQRLSEYGFLYNDTVVPSTWWGWRFWNASSYNNYNGNHDNDDDNNEEKEDDNDDDRLVM